MAAMEAAASIAKRGSISQMTPQQMNETLKKVMGVVKAHGYKNVPWPNDFTGLHLAAACGEAAAIRELLEGGAAVSLDAKDKKGKTPFDYAWDRSKDPAVMSLLVAQQEPAPIDLVKSAKDAGSEDATWTKIFGELRAKSYVTMRLDISDYSLLHWAARYGKQLAVETLVNEFDADVAELTADGLAENAAAVAIRFKHDKLAEWLNQSGTLQAVFKDSEGRTIRMKKSKADTLDLFVDGRQRVVKMLNVKISGDTMTFEGNRIMFSQEEIVSSEFKDPILQKRIIELGGEVKSEEQARRM